MCEMKQEGQFSKNNNLLQYAIQLVCVLKWNKRDSFQKKNTIYYSMLFNLCAYWNETRGTVFKKNNLLQYAIQLVCILKWNKMDSFQKNPINDNMLLNLCAKWNKRGSFQKTTIYYSMLFNLCAYWNETRGTVFKKKNIISKNTNLLQYAIQLVCVLKWNKRDSFQKKNNLLQYAIQLVCILKWNKRTVFKKKNKWTICFQKTTIYYSMLNVRNETRGAVFKKQQFITVCYSTCVRIEMKQEGQFSKKKKKHQFITVCYSTCVHIEMKQEGTVFKKIQLMTICYWTCVRNETRGAVFKKQQFITVCYSTCVRIEMKQEGQFSKNIQFITYAIQQFWNKRGSFQKTTIYYSMLFNLCAYWNETRGTVFKKQQFITVCYSTCVRIEMKQEVFKKIQLMTIATLCEMKQEGQFSKNNNLLQYAIQLVCVLKWNKMDSFQKNPINDNMLLNLCAKWNKRGSFQKTTIYYSMLFNLCAYWNETRGTVFKKKNQFITVCYSTCVHIEMKQEGQFSKKSNLWQYAIQLVCEMKQEGQFSKNNNLLSMLFNLCAYWNETRGTVFKKNTPIYYSMLFNLYAYWNETRWTVFKKIQLMTICYLLQYAIQLVRIEMKQEGQFSKNNNLLQYAIQLVSVLKWNKRDSFQKKTIYYSMLFNKRVCSIEMKQEGQFSKNNNLLQYAIQLVCVLKWNKRDRLMTVCSKKKHSFQKTTIYYSMLFNLYAYWNETRGTVFEKKIQLMTICYSTCVRNETRGAVFKKQQFITVCYSTCVRIEMKQEGQFSKKKTNLLQYAIQLVCILKWNKRDSFQKNPINDNMLLNLCAKWNKRGSFQKTTIYYSMLFNLCAYWNETRGTVFKKKKHQFITVCYSTCMHIEMKQDGQFSKKSNLWQYATQLVCEMKQEGQFSKNNNLLQYAIQLVCVLKWNKRDSFQKNPIYYSMLFNLCAYWNETICYWTHVRNETRGAVFKKQQFITVCYSTCVRIEMKQEGQFSKKKKTPIYYSMLFNLCAYWNETRGAVFKKQQFITVCYSTCVRIEMKQEGQFSVCCLTKKQQFITVCYSTCVRIEMKQEGQFSKKTIYYSMLHETRGAVFKKQQFITCMLFNLCPYWNETRGTVFKKQQFITVCYSTCVHIEMKQEG